MSNSKFDSDALMFAISITCVLFLGYRVLTYHKEPEPTVGEQPGFVPTDPMRYFMVSYTYDSPGAKEVGHGFTWFSAKAMPDNMDIRRFVCTHKDLSGRVYPEDITIENIVEFKDQRDYNNFTATQE